MGKDYVIVDYNKLLKAINWFNDHSDVNEFILNRRKTMNFMEALQQLEYRKFVKRPGWEDGYLCFMPEMKSIWKIIIVPQPNAGNWMPMMDDFLGQDWEVLEEKESDAVVEIPACS